MKKILFCAAVVALAAACTNEDDFAISQDNTRTKGLTFDVALAEGAATKGELWRDENGTYPFFWYAETDKINVLAYNNVTGTNGVVTLKDKNVWSGTAAEYKATQSAGNGKFTSVNEQNLISLNKKYDSEDVAGTTTTIVATYKIDAATTGIASKVDQQSKVVPGELSKLVLTTKESNAEQTVDRANVVNAPMYSVSTAIKEEDYNSLGERANLSLNRPFPVIRFTTKNTKDYIKDFGRLKKVELTALGVLKDDYTSTAGTVSTLAYGTGKSYTVIGDVPGFETSYANTTNPEKVTVSLSGGEWSDDKAVYMTVAPVNRENLNGKKEALKVVYEFEHITFTLNPARKEAADFEKALQTSNNWSAVDAKGNPNAVTPLPALDINNYNYLVTNETSGNDRTLIVIKGSFSDIFAENGSVAWGSAPVPVTGFKKIISKVALTNAELAKIKSFESLTDLTLAENTAIPANTFSVEQAKALVSLNLPKVTSVDKKFATNETGVKFESLKTLIMPAYEFNDEVVNGILFNTKADGSNETLETIDMSGVKSMMPTFGVERTMAFTNYTKLTTVTVKDGVIVAPNGFAGCTALKTIKGKLDISGASDAFKMGDVDITIGSDGAVTNTTGVNKALKSVDVCGTVVPDGAFKNCVALNTIKYSGNAIVPTSIGANAFENNIALKHMDLGSAKEIGAAAFKKSGLVSTSEKINTLTVGAEKLAGSVFEGTGVKMVKLTNAAEITGNDVFKDAESLTQVSFDKAFTLAGGNGVTNTSYDKVFGEAGNINFWVNSSQTGVSGNKLTLTYQKDSKTSYTQPYTFKSIQKN